MRKFHTRAAARENVFSQPRGSARKKFYFTTARQREKNFSFHTTSHHEPWRDNAGPREPWRDNAGPREPGQRDSPTMEKHDTPGQPGQFSSYILTRGESFDKKTL